VNAASRRSLVAVGLCAVGVAAALGWATVHALRLERREIEAQSLTRQHDSIRLALWRMDSALTPILARETARPYFHYSAFFPSERAYTSMLQDIAPGEHLVPSPLLALDQQFVKLYFQRSAQGELTSPQAPSGNFRDLVESSLGGTDRLVAAEARLAELGRILVGGSRASLAGATQTNRFGEWSPTVPGDSAQMVGGSAGARDQESGAARRPSAAALPPPAQQLAQSSEDLQKEYQTRQQLADRSVQLEKQSNAADLAARGRAPPAPQTVAAGKTGERAKLEDKAQESAREGGTVPRGTPQPSAEPAETNARLGFAEKDDSRSDSHEGRKRMAGRNELEDGRKDKAAQVSGADEQNLVPTAIGGTGGVSDVEIGDMAPVWRVAAGSEEPQLLLLRTVRVGESRLEQGCWLDWPALRAWLVSSVQDLLPGATLRPVVEPYAQADPEALGRRLAGISAELAPGPAEVLAAPGWTPMRTTLVLTWGAVVLSFGAIGAALLAARELAERRGQFVSAVTHELRTPLTTFCLYSQMLADGMVPEESARHEYLGTLRRESERLTGIVESVLEYARVGRSNGGSKLGTITIAALVGRVMPLLLARAGQTGVSVQGPGDLDEVLASAGVAADPVSVERILGNLVDNACKYAPGSPVRMSVRAAGRGVEIEVADGGPGIPREQRGRLFQPFERGRSLAHATTPGLGLGLALSRELARRMGGDLELRESSSGGSVFVLRLARGAALPRASAT